jgi:hypothetical protein
MYMPSKDKKRKKKGKKAKLTTEEVLKLLKKLRPKTQQTVRVNVGDATGKSKNTPPFLFPNFPQQAIVTPAPLQPPAPAPFAAALPMSQQTQLQPWIIPSSSAPAPPPLARQASYITDAESGAEIPVKVRRSRKKAEEAAQGYSVSAPRTFTAPRTTRTSQLAAYVAEPTRFSAPVENDPFQPAIQRDEATDQMGNEPAALPSDQWTGTPSGDEQPLADFSTVAPPDLPPAEPAASTAVERVRTIPEIAQAFGEEEPFGETATPVSSPAPQSKPERLYEVDYLKNLIRDAPKTAIGLMRQEILQSGYAGVPPQYLTSSGRLKSKLSADTLFNIYLGT